MTEVTGVLTAALAFPGPSVPVVNFIARVSPVLADVQVPALVLYLLNVFSKDVILQFINESSVDPKKAEPVGIICSSVFAQNDFRCKDGSHLTDIFVAKFHVVCPVLFGIYGDDKTPQGKQRLGWKRGEDGAFVSDQRHFERMVGLAVGFSSMALRNYRASKLANPYPVSEFWRAVAAITNVPGDGVTETHLFVLRAMIDGYEQRIISFFGDFGVALLRRAIVEFPQKAKVADSVAVRSLTLLAHVLEDEHKLYL